MICVIKAGWCLAEGIDHPADWLLTGKSCTVTKFFLHWVKISRVSACVSCFLPFQGAFPRRVLFCICRQQISPSLLLAEHIQLYQLLLTHHVLQPLLDWLQSVNVFLVLQRPKVDIAPQLWSHNCRTEGNNHFVLANAAQDAAGLPCYKGALLDPAQLGVHWDLQALSAKLLSSQSDLHLSCTWGYFSPGQGLVFHFVELN